MAKKLLDKCLNLIKDHSSLTLSDGLIKLPFFNFKAYLKWNKKQKDFQMDITDIMFAKQQQKQSKAKQDFSDLSASKQPTCLVGDDSAMELAIDNPIT